MSSTSGKDYRRFFAYGSNIDTTQMKNRCPDSNFVGVASLARFRFIINSRGVATVVPRNSIPVYGVLWDISERDEENLTGMRVSAAGHTEKSIMTYQAEVNLSDMYWCMLGLMTGLVLRGRDTWRRLSVQPNIIAFLRATFLN